MTQSSKTLYRGTPYLDDLQQQLGEGFNEMVANEVQQFKIRRQNLQTKIEEQGEEEESESVRRSKKILRAMPKGLRHTGAFIAGPSTLPRGETTQLPLAVRGSEGRPYVVGQVVIHTEIGGQWKMVGYDSESGIPKPLEADIKHYQPDDLEQAMGSIDGLLASIDRAAGSYIQLDEKRSSASAGVSALISEANAGANAAPEAASIGEETPKQESSNQSGSSRKSRRKSISDRASRILGTTNVQSQDQKILDETGHDLNVTEIYNRLKKKKYKPRPDWFNNIKNMRKREAGKKKWKKLWKQAKPLFNKAKGTMTIKEFWDELGRRLRKKGVLSEDYCWETSRKLDMEPSGKCPFRHQCHKHKPDESGKCEHRSYRQ